MKNIVILELQYDWIISLIAGLAGTAAVLVLLLSNPEPRESVLCF